MLGRVRAYYEQVLALSEAMRGLDFDFGRIGAVGLQRSKPAGRQPPALGQSEQRRDFTRLDHPGQWEFLERWFLRSPHLCPLPLERIYGFTFLGYSDGCVANPV